MIKKFISVASHALYPLPCHKLSHLLGPPSSVTFSMDGPLKSVMHMGPSIYDVHTEGERVRLRWTHVDWGRGVQPHVDVQKLEPTDVILSSSHAKKLASFFTRISSLDRKNVEIFLRYKLVI